VQKISTKSYILLNIGLFIFLIFLVWLSLFTFSSFNIKPIDTLNILNSSNHKMQIVDQIMLNIRLPRAIVAAICGAALGASGAVMQAITNNPLSSPSILGINSGAALGMACVSTLAPWLGIFGLSSAALFGGSIVWIIVMIIGKSWQYGNDNIRLVLAGVAMSALCAALTKALIILEEDQATGIIVWLAGSFTDTTWNDVFYLLPSILICTFIIILISPKLNLLQLGDEYAVSLGISPKKYKILGSIIVLIMVSAVISTVGSLGFVGLLIPHMARFIIGSDHRKFIPLAMLLGACLVLLADVVSRAIIFPMETPAGAILALIGAPFFIYLVRRNYD
jgi:iron complex transport system permease protein